MIMIVHVIPRTARREREPAVGWAGSGFMGFGGLDVFVCFFAWILSIQSLVF
jgi:hypothetical protein